MKNVINNPNRNEAIHLLRGFTIFAIVFQHCMSELDPLLKGTGGLFHLSAHNMVSGLTTTFVIIAGYLFQHLNGRYSTAKHYKSKAMNVLLPYLVVSFFSFIIFGLPELSGKDAYQLIAAAGYHLIKGDINYPLWFIPMIMVIYILGPLLYKLSKTNLIGLAIFSFTILSVYQRPLPDVGPVYNALYFFFIYIIGMMLKQHQEALFSIIEKNKTLCFILVFIPAAIAILKRHIDLPWEISTRRDQVLVVISILMFYILSRHKLNQRANFIFSKMGDCSFAIFFLHLFFIRLFVYVFLNWVEPFKYLVDSTYSICSILACIIVFIPSVTATALFSLLIKKVLGTRSRMLIGY